MPINYTAIWLIAGVVLCLIELFVPTAFIASVLGISAIAVAAVATFLPFNFQVALWMLLSLTLVWLSRRFVQTKAALKLDAVEAETLTEIPPGKTGRVLYEGNSWQAQCEDSGLAIAPNQKVYVVRRKGTTLIVMPEHLLHY